VTPNRTSSLLATCVRAMPVTGAGLSLMTAAGPVGTVAASDQAAAALENLQFALGEGPSVDCSHRATPILQPHLAVSGPARWPAFTASATAVGINALFALPLRVGAIRLGVLDLYRKTPGRLSDEFFTTALRFAEAATDVLLHLQAQQHQPATHARGAGSIPMLEDHAEIHRATGMVSVQARMPLADALVCLRAHAYATERPLVDVALDVISGVATFTDKGEYWYTR
jgi:hypothetical protein